MTDFIIDEDQGGLFMLTPVSDAAQAWVEEHLPDDTPRWGLALAVEHRFIAGIVEGIVADGLGLTR
jgi:hypothetical protein